MNELKNQLYYGDNLQILRGYIPDQSIDLIYLDPPFNSKATYNVLFDEQNGTKSKAQIIAFDDTWHWNQETEESYYETIKNGPKKLADLLEAYRIFLGQNDMMAYLTMMAPRLLELYRVLKPTGSIYLHCDPTASHYLKLLMDAIFGQKNFQNEIIWCYKSGGATKKRFGRKHDVLFFYSKNPDSKTFNTLTEKSYMMHKYGFTKSKFQEDKNGQYSLVIMKDWWELPSVGSADKQRLGYPTQKPEKLLERIIKASSNEKDIILDPFCGCGTTISVAEQLNRRWIGIDITYLAINLIKNRLHDAYAHEFISKLSDYEIIGDPKDLNSAYALANESRYQFEWWVLGLADARPANDQKKGADTGIDGHIIFFDDNSGKSKRVIIQVKSGKVNVSHVRDLKGVMARERSPIAALLTLEEPTKPMLTEAAVTGFYEPEFFPNKRYPRFQIITIEKLLSGEKLKHPELSLATFKKAKKKTKETQTKIF